MVLKPLNISIALPTRSRKELVFALYQFNGLYGGGYSETKLHEDGKVYSQRITPFARQARRQTNLNESQIQEFSRILSKLTATNCDNNLNPQESKLYSALIFQTDKGFLRCNFIGQIPGELQLIRDSLNVEYEKADKEFIKELEARKKVARAKYGDWEQNPEYVRYSTSGWRSLKNKNTILLYLRGKRQPVTENSKDIPLYYALISSPDAYIVGGVSSGTWGFEPYYTHGVAWNTPENFRKELPVRYDVMTGSISVDNKIYQLKQGNLFVIKIDKNWKLQVFQLKNVIGEITDDRSILSVFEKKTGENLFFMQQ